ncbi:MAG TPA: TIGR00701 family protein [Gammaproteobacteria bacterium]|jgi:putative membrane protein|nr:CopD family protein [Gammaproteobacteria bacterium]HAY41986.1 TIGR00701 family protein [Gammaproteobacteria bacterium]|tara:strand:+ start:5542 stop:5967 length:426 start_codon:yes stop_codon:yes gene_type:complete
MLWVKAIHIFGFISWLAGMFYLPRLFVYHSMADDKISIERFKLMELRLYRGIMMPSLIVTTVFGLWMVQDYAWEAYSNQYWLQAKLVLVGLLIVYHFYCGYLVGVFAKDKNTRSDIYYRWFNEVPFPILVGIIILAVVRPF